MQLLTPGEAGNILGCGPQNVRVLEQSGKLPALRTATGRRLFLEHDVLQLAAEREKQKQEKQKQNGRKEST